MALITTTLYYTDKYIQGKLIKDDFTISKGEYRIKQLKKEEAKKLVELLEGNTTVLSHRCISVYRDAFEYKGNVYNICLSCGDFYKNNTRYYIDDLAKLRNFIKTLKEV